MLFSKIRLGREACSIILSSYFELLSKPSDIVIKKSYDPTIGLMTNPIHPYHIPLKNPKNPDVRTSRKGRVNGPIKASQ
jgi:hypothetical protein